MGIPGYDGANVIRQRLHLAARLVVFAVVCLALMLPGPTLRTQEPEAVSGLQTTAERLAQEGFWPRRSFANLQGHAGSQSCDGCHPDLRDGHRANGMTTTLTRATPESPGLEPGGVYTLGDFTFQIVERDGLSSFKTSRRGDEDQSSRAANRSTEVETPLEWVLGSGSTGHTYLFERDGVFFESRFSYFPALGSFADTPGRLNGFPDTLETAVGHALSEEEARGCFSCHSTALQLQTSLAEQTITPGVGCEGCHGPGQEHITRTVSGRGSFEAIFRPGQLDPEASLDFCGACHGTFWDLETSRSNDLATVRSPSYRLVKSPCWSATRDARLVCTACHDPHGPLETNARAYDTACLSCHREAEAPPKAGGTAVPALLCPVGTQDCTTCHMPKVELPELQVKSTDHWIRVVRSAGAEVP